MPFCFYLSIECTQIVLIAIVKFDHLRREGRIGEVILPHASLQNSGYLLVFAANKFSFPVFEALKSAIATTKKLHLSDMIEAVGRPGFFEHFESLTVPWVSSNLLE